MTNRFKLLLHNISNELDEKELRSLISLCDVSQNRRAEITDGMKLFEHLIQRDVISEEKINGLKELLKSLSPKRRDLINFVNDYMGLSPIEEDDCSHIVNVPMHRSVSTQEGDKVPCCTVSWPCLTGSFYKVHSVYTVLFVIFLIAIVICCMFWYGNVPHISDYLRADEHLKKAGTYIIICIICICFPVSLICVFYGRKRCKRHRNDNRKPLGSASEGVDHEMNICSPNSQDNAGCTANDDCPPDQQLINH